MQRILPAILLTLFAAAALLASTIASVKIERAPDPNAVVVLAGLSLLALWLAVRDYVSS